MKRIEKNSIYYHTFSIFEGLPLTHGVFERHGGKSCPPYDSLNFGLSVGDSSDAVQHNMERALHVFNHAKAVWSKQCHGIVVHEVKGFEEPVTADALITNVRGIPLLIKHADCQALLIYDPVHHTLGAVHSGWRGSVQNIIKETVAALQIAYGSDPKDLLAAVSPSLGPEASEFINYKEELPSHFLPFQTKPTYFDFWEISKSQLLECGILPQNIEIARICTYANPNFFSYRREKPVTGRNATIGILN